VTLIWRALSVALGAPRLARRVDAWAKPEAMLVVFERSALVRRERGVPVFRPGPSAGLWCERKEWRSDATDDDLTVREVSKSVKLSV
jgi:hypothetical protein